MTELITFLLKGICTIVIIPLIGFLSMLLALILWDIEFIGYSQMIHDRIWYKKH